MRLRGGLAPFVLEFFGPVLAGLLKGEDVPRSTYGKHSRTECHKSCDGRKPRRNVSTVEPVRALRPPWGLCRNYNHRSSQSG